MKDQAELLRKQVKEIQSKKKARAIAVLSGKGGVGKSNFSLNFSLSLVEKGYNVLLFDMDIGMGNIDILMGTSSRRTIVDLFEGEQSIEDIICTGSENLSYIAGGTGIGSVFDFSLEKIEFLIDQLSNIADNYDYLIFDMGAGMTEGALNFLQSVDDIVVISTPEPTSITDAYAAIKFMTLHGIESSFYITVNRAYTEKEGLSVYTRLNSAVTNFLQRETILFGIIPDDRAIQRAVTKQVPFLLDNPKSDASKSLTLIVQRYLVNSSGNVNQTDKVSFIAKLKKFFLEG
ncbi:MinD/ParA family protein [Metabacillus iocasae]|uniref:Flagellar biosynthesis protein FlhG n=1 Tax=Priestia iocasae TaxID=2291674 RepID=A0ABS2QTQ1_9BACI|nr:MinD/ParA family protein [Metabacillus iocasae]MBM7701884.1 flagellar biosynthesis protein FlhG [Metabacillus iocasae]